MSKWFDSKEDLIDELQSVAYQLDSASDGGDTLELLNTARDDLYMVIDQLERDRRSKMRWDNKENLDMESIIRRNSDEYNKED